MSLVKYCRCDDRLIHGQVIYIWVKHLGVKKIVVVDDETTNRMIEEGINIKKLIVGRIPTGIGKKKISQNVYINKKEFLLIDEFIKKNINVSIQMVPDEEEVELNQNINRYKGEFI